MAEHFLKIENNTKKINCVYNFNFQKGKIK